MNEEQVAKIKRKFGFIDKKDDKTIVDYLMEIPKKEVGLNMPITDVFTKNNSHQVDILYLPDDDGFKYALVCVDLAKPRYIGAEPMKSKTADEALKALIKIYKDSKYLKQPKRIEVDSGSEFQGVFKKHWEKLRIDFVVKKTGRHRQQACVEAVNGVLGYYLFKRMLGNEIAIDGEELIADWKNDLKDLIDVINYLKSKEIVGVKKGKRWKMSRNGILPVGEGDALNLLDVGTNVRVVSEEPRNIQGLKEHGTFRKSDMRWEKKPRKIKMLSLRPNQPPMYLVDGINNVAYTKQNLQVIKPNEKPPNKESISKFIISSLIGKRTFKGKVQYLIKWKNYGDDDNTWEYIKDIPKEFIQAYKKENN